jgi:hypothetical protein
MGYDHWIEGCITIDPPIPAAAIPDDHPLHPRHHPACRRRRSRAPVPPSVYGHADCVLAPDLMFEFDDNGAHAIVPATPLGHKLGGPDRDVEEAIAAFGTGRTFDGELLFQGEGGEVWTIEVIGGRVQVSDEEPRELDAT